MQRSGGSERCRDARPRAQPWTMPGAAREVCRTMVRGGRPQLMRGAPKLPVAVVALAAVISGVAAAPFTIVANVNSQMMVHMGDGTFFPQPEVSVECPEMPGLQCSSKVDGHRIIINVFHHTAERESIESTEKRKEDDENHVSTWWPSFRKPDRVLEEPYDISERDETSMTENTMMNSEEEEDDEEYDTFGQRDSDDRYHQNPSEEIDKDDSTDNDNSKMNLIDEENNSPDEEENETEGSNNNNNKEEYVNYGHGYNDNRDHGNSDDDEEEEEDDDYSK